MKSVILLLAALQVAAVLGGPVAECAWGESYWCSSLKTAKQCGAFDHCMTTVWMHHKITDTNDICQFCENWVGDLRKFISNKQTQDEIKGYMDAACGIIPVKELADQCKSYVDNDLPEVFKMLESELDPAAVCGAIGLCAGFEDKVPHLKVKKTESLHRVTLMKTNLISKLKKGDICADCKTLVADIKAQVTSKTTQDQLEQLLKEQLCANLGPLQTECNQLVDQYIPELLQMLSQEVDPAMVCGVLGFCQGGDKTYLAKLKLRKSALFLAAKQMGGEECVLCQTVMSELQNLDKDPAVQADIKNLLKGQVCARLGSLKAECVSTVDSYATIIFELLANELDPQTRCKSLGFCSAQAVSDVMRAATPRVKAAQDVTPIKQSAQCVLCEFVMKELETLLEKNTTEAAIIAALDKVCDVLPDTIKLQCRDFVQMYGPAIIQLITQELEPSMVCSSLGLCSQSAAQPSKARSQVLLALQGKPSLGRSMVGGSETCGLCETVIQYVDSLLQENATVAEIEAALDKVCNFLPASFKPECDNLIKQYGAKIVELIVQLADPAQICTEIGLCNKQKQGVPVMMLAPASIIEPAIVPQKQPLLGTKECTYGPSYWCFSKGNAIKCNAVAHCEKHGWLNKPYA